MMFGQNANNLGLQASITLLILFYIIIYNKLGFGKNRYILLILFPFLLNLMISTGSRVGFLSFFLGFIVLLDPFKYVISTKKAIVILLIIIAVILIWQFYLKESFVIKRLLNSLIKGDLSNRDLIWGNVIKIIKCHPYLGVGKTGYAAEINKLMGSVTSPHNVFLEVLCYTGWVGLIVFLGFFIQIIIVTFRSYRNQGELLPLVLLVPVFGMTLSAQIFNQKICWVLFAYIASRSLMVNKCSD